MLQLRYDTKMLENTYFSHLVQSEPDPAGEGYTEHALRVRTFDQALRSYTQSFLDSNDFETLVSDCVERLGGRRPALIGEMCTGSDGREEKGICSPIDLIVYLVQSELENYDVKSVGRLVRETLGKIPGSDLIGQIEIKLLERDITCFNGDRGMLWPDRVLDSQSLEPDNEDMARAARAKLVNSLSSENVNSCIQAVTKRIKERIATFRKICERGWQSCRGSTVTHFDLNAGEAYFDNSISRFAIGPGSFKQNALRLTQNCLNLFMFREISSCSRESGIDLTLALPTNTVDRLAFLSGNGLIDRTKMPYAVVERIADNYSYFMWLYHQSEFNYVRGGAVSISYNRDEVKSRISDLVSDCLSLSKARAEGESCHFPAKL